MKINKIIISIFLGLSFSVYSKLNLSPIYVSYISFNNLLKPEAPIASKEVKQENNDDNNNCLKPGAQIESKENDNINDKRKMIISSKFGSM